MNPDDLSVPGLGGGGVALEDGPLPEAAWTQHVEPAFAVWEDRGEESLNEVIEDLGAELEGILDLRIVYYDARS